MGGEKHSADEDSRALLPKDFECFIGKNPKKPLNYYVDLVKKHPELDLCFRGNSKSNPRISIYRNNHIIFTVHTTGKTIISFNHARYCPQWHEYFDRLKKEFGFNGEITEGTGGISVGEMRRSLKGNQPLSYEQISCIYEEILDPIFVSYYEAENKGRAIDYFKKEKNVNVQGKTEKIVQQQLYKQFVFRNGGYFFYDLEFAQRHKNDDDRKEDENNNKPDMWAIRFNEKGKPDKIVVVEVKCTTEAMKGTSGIVTHLAKMRKYDKLPERRAEACQLLNQYAKLELRGLSNKDLFNYDDFKNLELEILLVFTGMAAIEWEKSLRFEEERKMTKEIPTPKGVDGKLYVL